MLSPAEIDALIAKETFRRNVYNLIAHGASRILDFGCGKGALALRLMRDKACTRVHGLEIARNLAEPLKGTLDGVWCLDIEDKRQNLPKELAGYFNYIILHDVVEHFKDPWYCLAKLRDFLAPQGKLILATPNIQYWDFLYKILSGDFPYGPGLWHTGHIRWYTARSLIELLTLCGYAIETISLEIPHKPDLSRLRGLSELRELELPPIEVAQRYPELARLKITFPASILRSYPVFLAHKLIFVLSPREDLLVEARPVYNECPRLAELRKLVDNPFDVYNPPAWNLLLDDWN